MFDLNYFVSLKEFELSDDIQCNIFREMYKNKIGKNAINYTNNDIKNMIFKANSKIQNFKEKEMSNSFTKKIKIYI